MRERLAGPRGEQTRQLGNAVPLRLGRPLPDGTAVLPPAREAVEVRSRPRHPDR
jgi:hypothetical protein